MTIVYADHYILVRARQQASREAMAEQTYASAYQALDKGDDAAAKRLFGLLAMLAPRDERPWIGLAVCSERRRNWEMAAAMYRMGASLANSSAWSHFGRGRALARLGRRFEARRSFDAAEANATDAALVAAIDEARSNL